jgi:hypothetical protein
VWFDEKSRINKTEWQFFNSTYKTGKRRVLGEIKKGLGLEGDQIYLASLPLVP